jgi:hypothetical protein
VPRKEADDGLKPYEVRTGIGIPNLQGMNRHDDPAAMKANQHHLLVNVRLDGAEITDRPGSSTHENTGWPGCITGMIEVAEGGIGFWVTPCQRNYGAGQSTEEDDNVMGNFNEEGTEPFLRYNDEGGSDPPWNIGSAIYDVDYTPTYQNAKPWQSIIYFRRKYLQLGTRFVPLEGNPSSSDLWQNLWVLDFPDKEYPDGPVGYESYLDLFSYTGQPDREVTCLTTTFERNDDQVTAEVRIGELLYIGTNHGIVYVWDGATLIQSLDMGSPNDFIVRLATWPGGVFAVGSNGTDSSVGTAKAYVLPSGASSWTQVTLPATDFRCVSMESFDGKLYIFDMEPVSGSAYTRGSRLDIFDGETTLPAYSYEFPYTSSSECIPSVGLPFRYRNQLYAVGRRISSPQNHTDLYRRNSDTSWSFVMELNWAQDFAQDIHWVQVISQRIIMAGLFNEKNIGQPADGQSRYIIFEIVPWSSQRIMYYAGPDATPGAEYDTTFTGNQAIVVSPSQELDDEEV